MIRIHNIRTEVKENIDLYKLAAKRLHVKESEIKNLKIHKRSIDSRNKKFFAYVYDLDITIEKEDKYIEKNITEVIDESYQAPSMGTAKLSKRPIVVGAGPAGLFCAYELTKYGYKPIIIERGKKIEERIKSVNNYWENDQLDENSNVQFGEGGAGTFSDGKLNTLVKDKNNRMKEVFNIFVECGAPEEILYDFRPHIGTDVLREVIVNLRNKIISMGGEVRFNTVFEDLILENGKVVGIIANGQEFYTDILILALGHSARDTFKMLYNNRLKMEQKPFAVGVRIMHPQVLIDKNQYPINYDFLPPSSYKLTYKSKEGRGVYSFCMCPGGYVVNASSEKGHLVVNGMSNYGRDSNIANSAIVVTVNSSDFGTDIFSGMEFQKNIEKEAFVLGKGNIPAQKYIDYKNNQVSSDLDDLMIKGKWVAADINNIYPSKINESLKEGIDYFNHIIDGFASTEAIIAAPETRTSSPIRMVRNDQLESNINGIYPIGEGAGYAGGITTSAMDGIKAFEEIMKKYHNFL